MTDLFTATAPTEPGYYWWRAALDHEPRVIRIVSHLDRLWCDNPIRTLDRGYGFWGPRIPLPIAPPVEYDAVIIDGQCNIIVGETDVAQIRGDIPDAVIVRGVFVPTAIVETNDDQ